jgi:hypothetical protein
LAAGGVQNGYFARSSRTSLCSPGGCRPRPRFKAAEIIADELKIGLKSCLGVPWPGQLFYFLSIKLLDNMKFNF